MKVTKTYAIGSVKKKFMGDAMKANKSTPLKEEGWTVTDEENIKVFEVGKGDEVDIYVSMKIEKKRKEVQEGKMTKSSQTISRSETPKKYIVVKIKMPEGTGPIKRNVAKEELVWF